MTNFLSLPSSDKPFVYTSFVSTIDGKVFVHKSGYWPIGSQEDYQRFTFLRAQADIIIDGKNTAIAFADRTIETIHSETFLSYRRKSEITTPVAYGVITNNPTDELLQKLKNPYGFKSFLITNKEINDPDVTAILTHNTLNEIMQDLFRRGYKKIFIDGGPTLISSLIEEELLDDIFLTIAPKIFGTESGVTQTLAEGKLFPSDMITPWVIKNVEQVKDELFIRYAKK